MIKYFDFIWHLIYWVGANVLKITHLVKGPSVKIIRLKLFMIFSDLITYWFVSKFKNIFSKFCINVKDIYLILLKTA